ncbi:hypothetical protein [Paraclostridium bifermentans]|uniref:hypothetical protein n=1 Tax=Paraclostridium bifermentans TaxID=1490 RepID=UPI0018FE9EA2|nr:hypothetical protein [Paraclostridium bifermentans]
MEYTAVTSSGAANTSLRLLLNGSTVSGGSAIKRTTTGELIALSTGLVISAPNVSNTLQIAPDSSGGNIFNSGVAGIPNISIRIIKLN